METNTSTQVGCDRAAKVTKELLAGKKVLIMGLGRFGGGVDAAKFVCQAGAKVTVTDLASAERLAQSIEQLKEFRPIEYHLDGHSFADFEQADTVVANPAVPLNNEYLSFARKHGKVVTSQISMFFELCPAAIVGITGSNGKSTTAALTAHLLRAATRSLPGHTSQVTSHRKVWLSGNIGNEPLLTALDEIAADDLVVLELSSFQIELLGETERAPEAALLTNLTPNHLDRYGTFEAYCAAKENIFKFQRPSVNRPAVSIFNTEDEIAAQWFEKYNRQPGRVCIKFSVEDVSEPIRDKYWLPGRANLSNLAAALAVAGYFGVDDEQIKAALPEFKALPHRLELVAKTNGVRWYNDSKATTPEGAISALESFNEPEIIIAGGYDKHIPFDRLGEKISQKTKAAILIGETAHKISDSIKGCSENQTKIRIAGSLVEAVEFAHELAVAGDVVLLSPACASYDMFQNYEHRGREFARLVRQINH
jgi:UDP-N-acetylmuramoylalanine--D-glutamate ligase